MLVSAKEMLQKARDGKYAVGQFNINNLEWTKSILLTAEELKSPVILGVSEGAGKYMTGFKTVSAMVKAMIEELGITVPVALHLDHGTYEGCYAFGIHFIRRSERSAHYRQISSGHNAFRSSLPGDTDRISLRRRICVFFFRRQRIHKRILGFFVELIHHIG